RTTAAGSRTRTGATYPKRRLPTKMVKWIRSTAFRLPLFLLAFLLAGCSLFGSGTHQHPSVTSGDRPWPQVPDSADELLPHAQKQVVVALETGTSWDHVANALGARVVDTLPNLNAILLQLPHDSRVVDAVRRLKDESGVRYAEPNYVVDGGPEVIDTV